MLIEDALDDTTAIVVVPDILHREINTKIDAALATMPADAAFDRELFYKQLITFFHKYGYVPDFVIERRS